MLIPSIIILLFDLPFPNIHFAILNMLNTIEDTLTFLNLPKDYLFAPSNLIIIFFAALIPLSMPMSIINAKRSQRD